MRIQAGFSKVASLRQILCVTIFVHSNFAGRATQNPELGGILDDTIHFNVEHILPQSELKDWQIPEQTALQFRKRLGNMVLLNPDINAKIGGIGFSDKKKVFAKSPLLLTQAVAKFAKWGPAEIDERQEALSDLALKIWPAPK